MVSQSTNLLDALAQLSVTKDMPLTTSKSVSETSEVRLVKNRKNYTKGEQRRCTGANKLMRIDRFRDSLCVVRLSQL